MNLTVSEAQVTLHPADIVALATSPFQVITPPAAGKAIFPLAVFGHNLPGTQPYSNGDVPSLQLIVWSGPPQPPDEWATSGGLLDEIEYFLTTTDNLIGYQDAAEIVSEAGGFDAAQAAGGVYVRASSPGYTGGDGSLRLTIVYAVVTAP